MNDNVIAKAAVAVMIVFSFCLGMVIVNQGDVSSVTSDATHCMNKHGRKQIESSDAVLESQWTDENKIESKMHC